MRVTSGNPFYEEEYQNSSDFELSLIKILYSVHKDLWIPISVFPRYKYQKESKMKYCDYPLDITDDMLSSFREKVKSYILSLDVKNLFLPPPELILKVSSSRYNDGGVVRHDYERGDPRNFSCGFLYQVFNPKPLGTREVWLPDRATKISNGFWMLVGRQFLKADPTYPKDDPLETWESIKDKLVQFAYFDMSGFGFQYPRQYLRVVSEVISRLYPSQDLFEQVNVFHGILDNVKVQMPNGTYKRPVRGIGLGYYEDLKTIGVNALLKQYNPISVYGDQALLPQGGSTWSRELKARVSTGVPYKEVINDLRRYQFIILDKKIDTKRVVKWSGWTMNTSGAVRPKSTFQTLVSAFHSKYHWERKMIIRSFFKRNEDRYRKRYTRFLPFLYETIFGYELFKGDSLTNFDNVGVSTSAPVQIGDIRTWKVESLISPYQGFEDCFSFDTPFFGGWKEGDAKEFSLLRKSTYKQSRKASTFLRDYVQPKLTFNLDRKIELSPLGRVVSDYQEAKLLIHHRMTTGRFTCGLDTNQMRLAIERYPLAPNPYKVMHQVATRWKRLGELTGRSLLRLRKLMNSSHLH